MEHTNTSITADVLFEIDKDTRNIKNISDSKLTLVQYDHNSQRFAFSMPRTVDGHDMAKSDKVEVHYINIDSSTGESSNGVYEVMDVETSEDPSRISFSWLISQNATKYVGILSFVVRFSCFDDADELCYVWGTNIFSGVLIGKGMYNGEVIAESYADVLKQWEEKLFDLSSEGVENIKTATVSAIKEIEDKGAEVKESLPKDYTELTDKVENLQNDKADMLILSSETGKEFTVTDSTNMPLVSLSVYGESNQESEPTPETPIDVASIESPTITITDSNGENPQTVTLEGITLRGLKKDDGSWYDRDEIIVDVDKGTVALRQSILEQVVSSSWNFNNYSTSATFRGSIALRRDYYSYNNPTIIGLLCNYTKNTISGKTGNAVSFSNAYPQNTNLSYRYEYFGVSNYDEFIAFLKQCEENGKPLTWYAARETPIETDYTDTEWGQALLRLYTSYPTTNVLCDTDCSITYKADTTNAYNNVKNELDTLKQAIISLGGTI